MIVPAPLEGIANPLLSPNPAKAPWYFMGLQELLLHFHPLVGAILIPAISLGLLAALPFMDINLETIGVYFRSHRGRALALLAAGSAILITPIWIVADEFLLDWTTWLPGWPTLVSDGLIPFAIVLLGLVGLDDGLQRFFSANKEERILFLFIFLLMALLILTLTGLFSRVLVWQWFGPGLYPSAINNRGKPYDNK
ncbi:MAG: hypothetical protein IPN59_13275 [Holophaga sp.]|nr:hypothetical protein [Holophaga sp.]